jgi:D-psicose/D-tagatose/L-ribulose 3-epimerase
MQKFELKNRTIREAFLKYKREHPEKMNRRIQLSWSNWGFGIETFATSVKRLAERGVHFIELHGNRYSPQLGYNASEVQKILAEHGVRCSGICGMFSKENKLASNSGPVRQHALDYIQRNLELGVSVGARYFLIVPGAVGRPQKIDDGEFERSVEALKIAAPWFESSGIRGAVEPIRSAEVSLIHTFKEALRYIDAVDSPAIQHINVSTVMCIICKWKKVTSERRCGSPVIGLPICIWPTAIVARWVMAASISTLSSWLSI